MRKPVTLLAVTAFAALPALAQPAEVAKFPTPPPPVTAENSVIGPDYANAPEAVANPAVPEGDYPRIHPVFRGQQDLSRHCSGS